MRWRRLFDFPAWDVKNPFAELERMQRDMDTLANTLLRRGSPFRTFKAGVFPLVNVTEDKDKYVVRAELPGMKAEDLDIQVSGKNLSLSGERKIADEKAKYHRKEREAGRFSRVITLPGELNSEKVEAKLTDGILNIVIPKAEAAKPRQISVS